MGISIKPLFSTFKALTERTPAQFASSVRKEARRCWETPIRRNFIAQYLLITAPAMGLLSRIRNHS